MKSYEDFLNCAKDFAHFAFKRTFDYFHHKLIKAKEKVVEYCVSVSKKLFGAGKVVEVDFSEKEIRKAISDGKLYFIDNPDYPKTEEQMTEVKCRCKERLGEKAYAVAYNNCEHLVKFIMTGEPLSEQIEKAGSFKMFLVDTVDVFVSHAQRNTKKMICSGLLGCIPISLFGATVLPIGASTLISGCIEALYAWSELTQLKSQRSKNHVNEKDYKREMFRTIGGAFGATIGNVIGGCLGLACLPIPALGPVIGPKVGCAVGSMAGNYVGRWIGSVCTGRFFDSWFGK